MSNRSIGVALSMLGACLVLSASSAFAAKKAEKNQAAERLVKEALHREIYGLTAERDELLAKAAATAPDYAPAQWHQGMVRYKGEWIKAVDLPQVLRDDPRVDQYLKVRADHENTVEGQLEVANWCRKRGLPDQERAHLMAVVQLNPNHAEARDRLGFRRVDGQWMETAELRESLEQLQRDRQTLAKWLPEIDRIQKGLHHRAELKRNSATEKLRAIKDVDAIGAIERVLVNDSPKTAMLVVETFANMSQGDASLALARQAIFSPWPEVREAAAKQLKNRPEDSYVPALLATLYTPLETHFEVFEGRRGRLMYRHAFFREGQDENQLLVLDAEYRRVAVDPAAGEDTAQRVLNDVMQRLATREMSIAQQNRVTAEMNTRVMQALSTATEQEIQATPEKWWDWWTAHNEVFVQGDKQTRTLTQSEQIRVVDRIVSQSGADNVQQLTMDCLAAGTKVWTATGPVAIEKIVVGDLVLSQDTETGELSYKPVLRTTVRPASGLVKIEANGDEIQTSGGHPFWVAGEGWIKARDLQAGMELHTEAGTVRIESVEKIHSAETYNLIVADFNTYFVGNMRVLSHDNTVRGSTDAIVPGLAE